LDSIEKLKRSVGLCMFDQYGTVVDMQSGLTEASTPFLKAKAGPAMRTRS